METLAQVGITHCRTAYPPSGRQRLHRTFHRSLKEEEVWTSEYRSLGEARKNIGRYLAEYNHDRPHYEVGSRTPNEAFLSFAVLNKKRGSDCLN